MPSLRIGVIVRWPEVELVVIAMLQTLGHQPVSVSSAELQPPDVVVRDSGCVLPTGWEERPEVVLSGSAVGVMIETAGKVRVGKPFSLDELTAAILLVFDGAS